LPSGVMNTAGILGGIASTLLVPILVQHFGWLTALSSGAVMAVLCGVLWWILGSDATLPSNPEPASSIRHDGAHMEIRRGKSNACWSLYTSAIAIPTRQGSKKTCRTKYQHRRTCHRKRRWRCTLQALNV